MADMDKDRLKELEIESILEETHYLADQERMEQTAQKYRAKPKIEEIFSNADKKPRLKNTNPLDEFEPDTSNSIVGDKTAATMQAELEPRPRAMGISLRWVMRRPRSGMPSWSYTARALR